MHLRSQCMASSRKVSYQNHDSNAAQPLAIDLEVHQTLSVTILFLNFTINSLHCINWFLVLALIIVLNVGGILILFIFVILVINSYVCSLYDVNLFLIIKTFCHNQPIYFTGSQILGKN